MFWTIWLLSRVRGRATGSAKLDYNTAALSCLRPGAVDDVVVVEERRRRVAMLVIQRQRSRSEVDLDALSPRTREEVMNDLKEFSDCSPVFSDADGAQRRATTSFDMVVTDSDGAALSPASNGRTQRNSIV